MFERIGHSLIYHERPEPIAHGRSFVMSDLSDSLKVYRLIWATWAIRSQSLICLERSERIAHIHWFDLSEMSKWANERIPSPVSFRSINVMVLQFCICTIETVLSSAVVQYLY